VRTSAAIVSARLDQVWNAARENPLRRLGFFFMLAYVFTRFGYISEILGKVLDSDRPHLVIVLGGGSALLTVLTGGLQRSFRSKAAYIMAALMLWMVAVAPFGIWRRGSLSVLIQAFETEFSMLFIIAGLVLTLREVRQTFAAIALGAAVVVTASLYFGVDQFGRFSFTFGSLGNANDYATHLLVVLPFALLFGFAANSVFVRLVSILVVLLGVLLVLRTGSRAGLLALMVSVGFMMLRATPTQRILGGLLTLILLVGAVITLPRSTLLRYLMIVDSSVEEEAVSDLDLQRAVGSTEGRKSLLLDSLTITAHNPLFGVGPGNFTPGAADLAKGEGRREMWLVTHNTYTEVSSETGVPGLILLLATLVAVFRQLGSIWRRARKQPEANWIRQAAFCLTLSMTNFSICIFFCSISYRFYLPAMVGLVVSFAFEASRELDHFQLAQEPAPPSQGPILRSRRAV
jgi:O-antigen ligase